MDQRAISELGIPSLVLMENAARSAFEAIQHFLELDSKIVVFLGGGNNGGDGYALARICKNHGWEVAAVRLVEPTSVDCQKMAEIYCHFGQILDYESFVAEAPEIGEQDIIIDAVLGTGGDRPLEGALAEQLTWINTLNGVKIALDLPSGVRASSGDVLGVAFRAEVTLALACPKLGHYLYPGRELRGGLVIKPISVPEYYAPEAQKYKLLNEEEILGLLKPLPKTTYKNQQGHLALLAGSKGMMGAAALAARSALRSGAGLATLAVPETEQASFTHEAPEVMTQPREKLTQKWFKPYGAVLAGCGLGREAKDWKKYSTWLKKLKAPLLLDADAFHGLKDLKGFDPQKLVLTPHQGEFLALSKNQAPKNNRERIEQGLSFVKQWGCTLILKGAPTLVFSAEGVVYVNETGNPGMATAGSGDVLAGLTAGLLTQGYDPLPASLLGVWLHGLAGDLYVEQAAEESLTAPDLIEFIGPAFAQLRSSRD